jgi:ferritin-like metal-binding protein YciE
MAEAAANEQLSAGFEEDLQKTKEHVKRLERILKNLGQSIRGDKCKAMEGLIEEAVKVIDEEGVPEIIDALLISAAQRVEHYDIAGYGFARAFAELRGEDEAVTLLQQTLDEEAETDEKLTNLAEGTANPAAQTAGVESAEVCDMMDFASNGKLESEDEAAIV